MHRPGTRLTRVLLAAATAGVLIAGTACTGTDSRTPDPSVAPLTLDQLRSVLVPLDQQPETVLAKGPVTIKQAAADRVLDPPPGTVFEPAACATYIADVVGPLDALDGWVQYGSRVNKGRNDNFLQVVVTVPGGADAKLLERIREALSRCRTGTLTLNGKVTGQITYEERTPPAFAEAATFAVTGTTRFAVAPATQAGELVREFEVPPADQVLFGDEQKAIANIDFAAEGSTLIIVHEADPALADQLVTGMHTGLRALRRTS